MLKSKLEENVLWLVVAIKHIHYFSNFIQGFQDCL